MTSSRCALSANGTCLTASLRSRVTGETRERSDAVRHVPFADSAQREEVIKGKRAECVNHAQGGEGDITRWDFGQRGQDHTGIDALQRKDQGPDRKGNNQETCRDPESFPADPFLETTRQRGQQALHSSSRQGRQVLRWLIRAVDRKRQSPLIPEFHKAKRLCCAVLD